MQKDTKQQFLFDKVVTFPYYINYILGFAIALPLFYIYGETGFRYFGTWGLIFTFFIFGILIVLIIKFLSHSVSIYFDQDSIYIAKDKKNPERYLKSDVTGFYSYDYEQVEKSFVSIEFLLRSGKKITFTDTSTSEKIDKEKAQILRQFLAAAKKELDFTYIKKNKIRSLQKLGACFYARPGYVDINN